MEAAGGAELHVHRPSRMAHHVPPSGEIQEDPQEHHHEPDGHPGGGHAQTGERGRGFNVSPTMLHAHLSRADKTWQNSLQNNNNDEYY